MATDSFAITTVSQDIVVRHVRPDGSESTFNRPIAFEDRITEWTSYVMEIWIDPRGATLDGGTFNSTSITISGGGLVIAQSEQIPNNAVINMTGGSMSFSGSGLTETIGSLMNSGGTIVDGGVLQIGNGGTEGSITGDVTNNASLIFDRSNWVSLVGQISGTGSVTKKNRTST